MADQIRMCIDRSPIALDGNGRLAALRGAIWGPGYNLKIRFLGGDPVLQQRVRDAALEWAEHARLQFFFVPDGAAEIRIAFSPGGSWSMVGREALSIPEDQPTMNFGWLTGDSSDADVRSVVLHEFGHALGCIHEHQHPDAGIPWDKEKVYAYYAGPPNYWSREVVDRNLFCVYARDLVNATKTADPDSIMMYPIDKALTDGVYEVGWNTQLSAIDKSFIRSLYL